ncbi:MAG TPA: redox-sensing transcriptional repressor Rex [Gaiellaceae bacterium]
MSLDETLGYCGLYCGGCEAFQATAKGAGIEYEPGSFTTCRGCNSSEVSIWCSDCEIKICARERGSRYCLQCESYPCEKTKRFLDDPKCPYHSDTPVLMARLSEIGLEAWADEQSRKWICKSCGGPFDWFSERCPACGVELLLEKRLRMGVAARLSRYLQVANQAAREGMTSISSYQISLYTGVNATQVRRDLSSFGKFGKRGSGYEIEFLCGRIRDILGARSSRSVVIVGAGRIGEALVRSGLFTEEGIEISAIFDSDPSKIGGELGVLTVRPASELAEQVKRHGAVAAVIAVPVQAAQGVADELVRAGVRAIFSYSEALLDVPEGVSVQTLNPAVELLSKLSSQGG